MTAWRANEDGLGLDSIDRGNALTALLVGLLAFAIAKVLVSGITTILWVIRKGSEFREGLTRHPQPASERDVLELFRACDGRSVRPLGVQGYIPRLYKLRQAGKAPWRRALGQIVGASAKLFNSFGFLASVAAVMIAIVLLVPVQVEPGARDALALGTALLIMLHPIFIAVEAVLAYWRMGAYGGAYYLPLNFVKSKGKRQLVPELLGFLYMVGYAAGVDTIATFYVGTRWKAYDAFSLPSHGWHESLEAGGNALYYTLMTFLTAGDADPVNGAGKAVTGLITVQGSVLVLITLGALISLPRLMPD